jgi:hypothetical protein
MADSHALDSTALITGAASGMAVRCARHFVRQVSNHRRRLRALRGSGHVGRYRCRNSHRICRGPRCSDTANRSIQHELFTVREWQHGLYFRDRWNVNPKLTLDLGLRWEYYPIMNRANRGMERFPLVQGPDTSSGRVPLPNTVGMTSPSLDAGRRPRTHSWNVAFERPHAAQYGGDPDTIVVMGWSAGAQLAALVCTDDRYLKAEHLALTNISGRPRITVRDSAARRTWRAGGP